MRDFADLSEREILALAISNEEEDGRIYGDFADGLRENYPASARVFKEMAAEENEHRRQLYDVYTSKFGDHIPLVRRQDVRGWGPRRSIWHLRPMRIESVRQQARQMETEAARFYQRAISQTTDVATRKLMGDLAAAEAAHELSAARIEAAHLTSEALDAEAAGAQRRFVLQIVQPGLVGLMDGSVSTLAPVFAAAFATRNPWDAFLVGMAASVGAGISMGFAEALSDDGSLTGRGHPWVRGIVCGAMTALGGVGHTLPFLIQDFRVAMGAAMAVVLIELAIITWVRNRYMETPPLSAALQVGLG